MWTTAKRLEGSVAPPPPPQHRLAAASSHWSTSNCGRKGRVSHSAPFSLEKEGSWVLLFVVLFCCCTAIRYLLFIIPYLSIMVYRIPEDTGILPRLLLYGKRITIFSCSKTNFENKVSNVTFVVCASRESPYCRL